MSVPTYKEVVDALNAVNTGLAAERKRRVAAEKERDEARAMLAKASTDLNGTIGALAADCEHLEADNAALVEALRWYAKGHDCCDGSPAAVVASADHPGAALLEQLRKQDDDICRMAEEIEAWKGATGLERGGDPDGVRPEDLARHIATLDAERDEARHAASLLHEAAGCTAMHTALAAERGCAADHIAALRERLKVLEVERDEERTKVLQQRERMREMEAFRDDIARERDALREHARAARIEGEEFGFRQATECIAGRGYSATVPLGTLAVAHEVAAELYRLRERVTALEADLDHSRKTSGKAIVEARERAAAAARAVEVWRTECREAESRLAAIRRWAQADPSAPDTEWWEGWRAAQAEVRDILGDDAPAPSELDGMRGEMAEVPYCDEHGASNGECSTSHPDSTMAEAPHQHSYMAGCNASCPPELEPTTAEAFATVRNGLHVASGVAKYPTSKRTVEAAQDATTELERRMGAMERALRGTLSDHGHLSDCGYSGYPDHQCVPACAAARAALTDAPPVFTLEEVEEVLTEAGIGESTIRLLMRDLTALRK